MSSIGEEWRTGENEVMNLQEEAYVFLNDRSKANNLINIIEALEKNLNNNDPVSAITSILEVVFVELLKREEFNCDKNVACFEGELASATQKYCLCLKELYEEGFALMLKATESEKSQERTHALVSCMKLLAVEGKYPLNSDNEPPQKFPVLRLKSIIEKLLTNNYSQKSLIEEFQKFGKFADVTFYTWFLLHKDLVNQKVIQNENSFRNLLCIINAVQINKSSYNREKTLINFKGNENTYTYGRIRRSINKTWNSIMQCVKPNMPKKILKQLLITLLECVMPHLDRPLVLTDFLMDSLNLGGAVSLLALEGVFTLIQKHNITYPNVYEKLYCLFEPSIFHTRYKARLFYLADIFLSSTHLPENLVAAFIKRLARLSLSASPHDIIVMLHFIHNLILRHPDLKKLIYAEKPEELKCDPYNMNEMDPAKSNALNSSLWEIASLEKHVIPTVANAAKCIVQQTQKHEFDLSKVLELKEDQLFEQEINRKVEQYTLSFERPLNLFLPKNDKFQENWSLIL